jgi:hypothetical protein
MIPMSTTSTKVAAAYVPANTLVPCLTVAGRDSSRKPTAASMVPTCLFGERGRSVKSAMEGR